MTERDIQLLLVEADEDDALILSDLLAQAGGARVVVTRTRRAGDALAALAEQEFDVCLVANDPADDSGLDLLAQLRRRHAVLPLILLSKHFDDHVDRAAMAAGAVDYLAKGELDSGTLERSIRYAVGTAASIRSLQESEQRFRTVVESATDGIALLDRAGQIVTCNGALVRIFGLDPEATTGVQFGSLIVSPHGDSARVVELERIGTAPGTRQATGLRRDGTEFPLELSLSTWTAEDGQYWTVIARDVTERIALAEQLEHQAFHDPLTGLANRALFRNRVEHSLARLSRNGGSVAVLFLDIDNFKRINDTHGHSAGDALLQAVAMRLQHCVRPEDTIARFGGDEFALCLESNGDPTNPFRVAERVLASLRNPVCIAGRDTDMTGSLGVAIMSDTDADVDALLRNADVAMYAAKSRGKDRYVVFENTMHQALLDQVQLEADLRRALDAGELRVVYQPILRLDDGRLKGFEALVRWDHPERGPQSPAAFIPLAEDRGLINQLGHQVLTEACHQVANWQQRFTTDDPLTVSVNLSSRQLGDPDLVSDVANVLDTSGLVPGTLILELTESVMMGDIQASIALLQKLSDLGVSLALDDFGTGYSSLSYLRDLPLNIVKVDRSFVNHLDDERGASLVRAIVAIGRSLGLETVAEGIESDEQAKLLEATGCRFGQGYLYARPMTAPEAEEFLNQL
jgi:diguanylate cyclase (GGDEF)-like protein/PAS domain S-box-containing protein